jgi:signal transduction histidine kinase
MGDKQQEWETVRGIERSLDQVELMYKECNWLLEAPDLNALEGELQNLVDLTNRLPKFLQYKMLVFRDQVRGQYRTWIVMTWLASVSTGIGLCTLVRLFYVWVFRPLRILIDGSRRVAAGDFSHRIQLQNHDEVAELATAMNAMTRRFQQIRDDLDEQVRQRTREVVRSEQLASVGFLAAGVAHEINNPLASIAWSAESLESRLYELLHGDAELDEAQNEELNVLRTYLRRIQDEAFRCKGITEQLLDFSRLGNIQRQDTDLRELIQSVIDMVKHLGKYRRKSIEFRCHQHVVVPVNAQEIKQVVLNLITNALDALEAEGQVVMELHRNAENAVLRVRDNGVGMTSEVLDHLFEPFFTRKRSGQGTGLGLSITYRIVTDHGGTLSAASEGPGTGAEFLVTLPLSRHEEEKQRQPVAA